MNHATDGNSANPQAGAGRPLPKKEADIFKNVVKHYEMKQYKKAIKQADTILKKFPNHGETLAMKGLTLNYMNKRDEAHALVKEGLRNDFRYVFIIIMKSFVLLRDNYLLKLFIDSTFAFICFTTVHTFVGTSMAYYTDRITITMKRLEPTNRH